MKQVYIMEDFDYEYQCWVTVAIGDNEDRVREKGLEVCGVGYDSQIDTRVRPMWVD